MTFQELEDAWVGATNEQKIDALVEFTLTEIQEGRIFKRCPKCGEKFDVRINECPHCTGICWKAVQTEDKVF